MQIIKSHQYFCDVEKGDVVRKPSLLPQPTEQLTSTNVLKQHIYKVLVLKGASELNNEMVVDATEDVFLVFQVLHLVSP